VRGDGESVLNVEVLVGTSVEARDVDTSSLVQRDEPSTRIT
jgi:hypothetical protein